MYTQINQLQGSTPWPACITCIIDRPGARHQLLRTWLQTITTLWPLMISTLYHSCSSDSLQHLYK